MKTAIRAAVGGAVRISYRLSLGCLFSLCLLIQPACKGKILPAGGDTPLQPGDPGATNTTKPVDPAATNPSAEPTQQQPTVPSTEPGPTQPTATEDPTKPTQPAQPTQPTQPGGPTTQPTTPADPGPTTMPTSTEPTKVGDADRVWTPLTVMTVVNPMDFGAAGNGTTDDLSAMNAAVNALPASGGIVFFPSGKVFKKTNLLTITKNHVKLWSVNRGAEVFQSIAGQRRHQSILCRNNGCGIFGLKLRSDASARFDALEDNQISADHGTLVELSGNEVNGSAASGIFLYGSKEHYISGNYVHHTWADHFHHTDGATQSWVWNNFIFNEEPSKGDDGIACVTYGADSPRCSDMEWFRNTILHSGWGRGYSVIGGENIRIHDNYAIGVAGAGIIIASENSYNTSASQNIKVSNNYVQNCGAAVGHPNILVSALASSAGPIRDVAFTNNVSVDAKNGAYKAEGTFENVTNTDMVTQKGAVATVVPTQADIKLEDTTVLRTRDVSHVPAEVRSGLYRIHVRKAPTGGFEQRFEYLVKGAPEIVSTYVKVRTDADDYLSEQRTVDGTAYALLLTAAPISLPSTMQPVTFLELRNNDQIGNQKLTWLWNRVDTGKY